MAACICHRHTSPSLGVMVLGAIGYTFRSPLVRIDGTLNSTRYITLVCHDPWFYLLFEACETLRFSRIMHDHMLPVLYRPSLIRKMFGSYPDLHVHQISCQ
ncbi:hypothetical protein TNCV_3171281 [Trichonephila clavipes]|nr:hypothetical protein TNCV_3171281 [Trichonephila clavipes]